MVIKNVNLEIVCGVTSQIPDTAYGEVAFAGKSNVGKSSLINTLMNRKSLARTSSQPGKTQTINFYNINNAMYLVDLPGYGYANANVEIKAAWGKMIERYLHGSKQLKAVFLLIDIRHDPSENDRMMYDWMLDQGFAPILIATKADKLNRSQVALHVENIRRVLKVKPGTVVIPFSATTRQGKDEVWKVIDELVLIGASENETGRTAGNVGGAGQGSKDIRMTGAVTGRQDMRKAGNERTDSAGSKPSGRNRTGTREEKGNSSDRKPRWKAQGKPQAKKTKKMAQRRKAGTKRK